MNTPDHNEQMAQAVEREGLAEELRLIQERNAMPQAARQTDMQWYWCVRGGHTHVRVFMNGGKCGDLCFRNEEFQQVREQATCICFHEE